MTARTSKNNSFGRSPKINGLFSAIVVAVDGSTASVQIPKLGLLSVYESVPIVGPTPDVDQDVFVSFLEGDARKPVAFTGNVETTGDITSIFPVADGNLSGGGDRGDVTLDLADDISLSTVAADFYGDLHGAIHLKVKNVSGGTLYHGDPVYATGSVGATETIQVKGSSAGSAGTMPAMGLLDQELENNGEGDVVVSGVLQNFDTGSYNVGDELYVAPSGGLTTTRPTGASDLVQKIGKVIRAQQQTGEILVQGAGRANDVPNSFTTSGDVTVGGDLTVNGTTVTLNTQTLTVEDNIIVLNSNVTGSPTLDAGIEIERGSDTNVSFTWNETTDAWTIGSYDFTVDTDTLHVDSTNNRVGIGTTTPRSEFHVQGSSDPELSITSTDASNPALYFGDSVDLVRGGIRYNIFNDRLEFQGFDNSTGMVIDSLGNVGIGTTTPQTSLGVDGDIDIVGASRSIVFGRQSEDGPHGLEAWSSGSLESALYYRTGPDAWSFENSSASKIMVVDIPNERVGIGTDSPSAPLEVARTTTGKDVVYINGQTRLIGADPTRLTFEATNGTNLWNIDNQGGTFRVFREDWNATGTGANGSVKMSITDTGNTTVSGSLTSDSYRWGGTNYLTSTTTANLMTELLNRDVFDSSFSAFKTGWSYAGNGDLTDAGGLTELAGTSWLTWTDNSTDNVQGNITALVIAPNAGNSGGGVFIYNDHGTNYAPGWREVWTSATDGAGSGLDADTVDGLQASAFATASHNHTYNVNDAWLRENGDNSFVKLYGNTRTMVFRTDGTTEYGFNGAYPFIWLYGGDATTNRRMILNDTGQLWLSNYGWLHNYFSPKTQSYGDSTANAGRRIYINSAAASGGSDGDIWLQYT